MISFERPREMDERLEFVRQVASGLMREKARYYDEYEHEIPWEFVNLMWERQLKTGESFRAGARLPSDGTSVVAQTLVHVIEVQSGGYLGEDDIVRFEDHYGRE